MAGNKCRGCVRAGFKRKEEKYPKYRGDFLPIRMKKCHCCTRNPEVKQKKDTFINHDRVGDWYMSKSDLIHDKARRRGMGAVCDDGRPIRHGNSRPSYTRRDRKYLAKESKR